MLFSRTSKTSRPYKDLNQEKAALLLATPTALADLTLSDARAVVGFMQLNQVAAGTVLIREGEATHTDFMMLILEGEVLVDNQGFPDGDSAVVSVLNAGSLIGEMGILDGEPRSATCTATTEVDVAVLSREALIKLIEGQPVVGARFVLAIAKRLANRLRAANRKIKTLGGVNRALQQELDSAYNATRPAAI